jgi:uncharacterized protein
MDIDEKYGKLREVILPLERVVVAFSGGVDSTLLLHACLDVLNRDNVLAFIGTSPVHPESETQAAVSIAQQLGVDFVTVKTTEMKDKDFTSNTRGRCYYCKSGLIGKIQEVSKVRGFSYIVEGSNINDENDFRPGSQAIAEKGVISPLKLAGLTKNHIRELSRIFGLPTHDKPSFACLASRIPYGTAITKDILKQIELSEAFLKGLGLRQVRVRYHGKVARIEIDNEEIATIIGHRAEVYERLTASGFTYVTLDLRGYRTGSLNENPSGGSE